MCSIFASTSKNKFLELVDLNQIRGKFSYSYAGVKNKRFKVIKKDFGLFDKNIVVEDLDMYIGHCQAPTGGLEKNSARVHPSQIDNQYLYHNGILKPSFLEKAKINYNGWDTFYLNYILMSGFKGLEEVKGSFACLFIKNNTVYFFRNDLCPLFMEHTKENEIHLSSVRFEKSFSIDSGLIYKMFGDQYKIEYVTNFKDNNKVYSIGDKNE